MEHELRLATYGHRAGGQDDGSLQKTPSNEAKGILKTVKIVFSTKRERILQQLGQAAFGLQIALFWG